MAEDLLKILQLMLRRVPGGLAIAVTLLGTIMAATPGIVGASVIMRTRIALPVMLQSGYDKSLSVGTIASAGTLGILISLTMIDIYRGITPFVIVQLAALAACLFWPEIVLRLPREFGFLD